jgi:thiosulfate reductase cytochrome b subunit
MATAKFAVFDLRLAVRHNGSRRAAHGDGSGPARLSKLDHDSGILLVGGRETMAFFLCLIFAPNGLLYVIYNIANGHMRKFLFTPRDAAACLPWFFITFASENIPQEGEYNPLQKMAYTSVF